MYDKGFHYISFPLKGKRFARRAEDVNNTADVIQELGEQIIASERNMTNLSERSVEINQSLV
ncbi:hypothetical protein ACI2OX_16255 [Bacillus sp. N9]